MWVIILLCNNNTVFVLKWILTLDMPYNLKGLFRLTSLIPFLADHVLIGTTKLLDLMSS